VLSAAASAGGGADGHRAAFLAATALAALGIPAALLARGYER